MLENYPFVYPLIDNDNHRRSAARSDGDKLSTITSDTTHFGIHHLQSALATKVAILTYRILVIGYNTGGLAIHFGATTGASGTPTNKWSHALPASTF